MKYLMIFLLLAAAVSAISVDSVSVPAEIWLGDQLDVTAVCIGDAERAYTDIKGPGVILPPLEMTSAGGGAYTLTVPGNYFDRKGPYTATITCLAGNLTANTTAAFTISSLDATMNAPNFVYEQDVIEINFILKKNDAAVTSGIDFSVTMDGQTAGLNMPPVYDISRGWLLRINAPAKKTYNLGVTANYQGKTISTSKNVEVRPQVDFSIISVDKNVVQAWNNITLEIRSMKRGSALSPDNLAVKINGASTSIQSVSQSAGGYSVKTTVPDMSSGRYQLTAEMTNNGTTYTASTNISYVSTLSGKIDGSSKNMQLVFYKSGSEVLRLNTLSDGGYSGQIIPDTYDVTMEFNEAIIQINGTSVSALNDPIDYTYVQTPVEGFTLSGIYYFKTSWTFNTAVIKLKYNAAFDDEAGINVFRCASWSDGKCLGSWTKIIPDINADQNIVTFSSSGLSAFAVGREEKIKLSMTFDKKKYAKRETVEVRGAVLAGSEPVRNATIRIQIENSYVDHTIYSNQNGAFALDFLGPEEDGNYTIRVTAKKSPYVSYDGNYILEVIDMPSFSVVFPGAVQVNEGNSTSGEILLVNTGQSEITGLHISLDIDQKFFEIGDYPGTLPMKQEIRIPVKFFAADQEATTMSAKLSVTSNEYNQEKIFGFTVLENVAPPAAVTGMAFAMPNIGNEVYGIVIFAIVSFSAAFLLKKSRRPLFKQKPAEIPPQQDDASRYLSEIKIYLNRKREA